MSMQHNSFCYQECYRPLTKIFKDNLSVDGAQSEIKIAPWGPRMGAEEVVLDIKDPKWKFILPYPYLFLLCNDFFSEKPRSLCLWGHFSLMHAFVYLTWRLLSLSGFLQCMLKIYCIFFLSKLKWRGTQIILKKVFVPGRDRQWQVPHVHQHNVFPFTDTQPFSSQQCFISAFFSVMPLP